MSVYGRLIRVLCLAFLLAGGACSTTPPKKEFPKDYSAEELRDMGSKFLGSGDTAQALKHLTLAEQKDPNDPGIQYYLGLAYGTRELYDKAQEHFEKALKLKPDYSEVYNAMGALHAKRGQFAQAESAFKHATDNPFYDTPHLAFFNLALLYENRGDTQKALSSYKDAVRLQPNFPTAYCRMGRLWESAGRRDEARRAYANAIRYDPNMAEAHFHFGRLSYLMGDKQNAYSSLTRVLQLDPTSPQAQAAREYLEKMQGSLF